jgi:3-keto-disaccharide hydrolase
VKRVLLLLALSAAAWGQDGFQPLFNGKNLDGWDGDPRLWSVRDGMIVGSTEGVRLHDNSFLISKKTYANFILRVQMKLRNHNSGIQFRSEALPNWVVRGYQADAAQDNYWGNIYEEKGRGTLVDGWKGLGQKVVRLKDWNDYQILCEGDHMQLTLNGLVTADLHDSARRAGIIAFQLHAGPPMEVYFRDVRIEILKDRAPR